MGPWLTHLVGCIWLFEETCQLCLYSFEQKHYNVSFILIGWEFYIWWEVPNIHSILPSNLDGILYQLCEHGGFHPFLYQWTFFAVSYVTYQPIICTHDMVIITLLCSQVLVHFQHQTMTIARNNTKSSLKTISVLQATEYWARPHTVKPFNNRHNWEPKFCP